MTPQPINTSKAPSAIGPYSQAILSAGFLFVSGQLPLDPQTGQMVEGDIGQKTSQVLHNIEAIAKEAGTSLDRAVKTTIFLTDLNSFAAVNEAYATFFAKLQPARSTVEVKALPLGSVIEIECILAT